MPLISSTTTSNIALLKNGFLISTSILTIISITLYLFQSQSLPLLEFSRSAIQNGEYYRLLTGNLMHSNHWHLLFNIAGLGMLTYLFYRLITNTHFVIFSTINAILVSVLMYYYSPTTQYYVGLSGYLHGLFVYCCLLEINKGMKGSWLLLLGVSLKIGYENIYGASHEMSELINVSIATDAHLFGALIALPQFGILILVAYLQKLIKR